MDKNDTKTNVEQRKRKFVVDVMLVCTLAVALILFFQKTIDRGRDKKGVQMEPNWGIESTNNKNQIYAIPSNRVYLRTTKRKSIDLVRLCTRIETEHTKYEAYFVSCRFFFSVLLLYCHKIYVLLSLFFLHFFRRRQKRKGKNERHKNYEMTYSAKMRDVEQLN